MHYYKFNDNKLFSTIEYEELEQVEEKTFFDSVDETVYYLNPKNPLNSRRAFCLNDVSQLFSKDESVNLLYKNDFVDYSISPLIEKLIAERKIKSINTNYPTWKDELKKLPNKWRINVMALGDVGSTLLVGLVLLGEDIEIGIYDRNENKLMRWERELKQIRVPFDVDRFPKIKVLNEDELFECDMFVFCASKGIPKIGEKLSDYRMVQFEENSKIVSEYAIKARNEKFKGIFAVVSDPVELLCKAAFLSSNKDANGKFDFYGLASNQIIGYGLGVMNARAVYYAEKDPALLHYKNEGRVFGPHGSGLVVADSIINYDDDKSKLLTQKCVNANIEVRELGFKPYVAPSLSSGALSILATIRGDFFYGSTLMKDAFFGSKMRLTNSGIEIEQNNLDYKLRQRIEISFNELRSII
ncbi:lactate dehydrogenase [Soehngenia saccharolytica]|nr:lactate dehydrogenase [Soehngenia saccharolytica]